MELSHLTELARRAHCGTSFFPEKRADMYIREYSELLRSDIAALPEGVRGTYRRQFEARFSTWMARKGNCLSSMITGPARFPTRRAERANTGERNAYDAFNAWRERFFKSVGRAERGKITPDTELESARINLNERIARQERMKATNLICRSKKTSEAEKIDLLMSAGYSEKRASELMHPQWTYHRPGYQSFELTNNGAMIRSLSDRVEMLERKIQLRAEAAEAEQPEGYDFEGGRVFVNRADDRIQIFHDEKPARSVIDELKKGWNWSPSNKCWQRKITGNAFWSLKQVCPKPSN